MRKDFELYAPLVVRGGLVVLHDISLGGGVKEFWTESRFGTGTKSWSATPLRPSAASVSCMSESVPPSRSRDFALTFGSSQLLTLITSVVGLVATPFLFRWLGPDRLGAWRVIESWVAYLGVLPTCLALATVYRLSQLLDDGDRECANRYLTTAAVVFTVVAAAVVAVGAAAAPMVPRLVSAPDELEGELVTAYLLVVGGGAHPARAAAVVAAGGAEGVRGELHPVGRVAGPDRAAVLALAYHRGGLPGQAAAVLVGTVVSLALQAAAVWRMMPWAGRGLLDRSAARGLLAATAGLLLAGSLGTVWREGRDPGRELDRRGY